MPVKWSPLRVSQAMDLVEEHLNKVKAPLELAAEEVEKARKIPNLPQYIDVELISLACKIEDLQDRPRSDIDRIRRDLPKDVLAAEKARQEVGEQTALV